MREKKKKWGEWTSLLDTKGNVELSSQATLKHIKYKTLLKTINLNMKNTSDKTISLSIILST